MVPLGKVFLKLRDADWTRFRAVRGRLILSAVPAEEMTTGNSDIIHTNSLTNRALKIFKQAGMVVGAREGASNFQEISC